jgi:hypothetical protein
VVWIVCFISFLFTERPFRFDCVLNEWNSFELFSFKENTSTNPASISDEVDGAETLTFPNDGRVSRLCLALEEGELETDPEEEEVIMQADAPLAFHDESLLRHLEASQFSPDSDLALQWSDGYDFLLKRWGLCMAGERDGGADTRFPMRLGLPSRQQGKVDVSIRALYEHVVEQKALPPIAEWDLSPSQPVVDGEFPDRPLTSVLNVEAFEGTYLLTIVKPVVRPWKIWIKDPLILLQIERERWHLRGDGLVSNLVQKGLPFQILYPSCQEGTVFYPNRGPVIHPEGKRPTHPDYLAYRLDVADFFRQHSYAHVAALCGGGICWRIAVDVLPIPDERDLIRPFHIRGCRELTFRGQRYWTPVLFSQDEEIIVGVYKWPGKSNK